MSIAYFWATEKTTLGYTAIMKRTTIQWL